MELLDFLRQVQTEVRSEIAERVDDRMEGYPYAESVFTEVVVRHMSDIGMTFDPVACHYAGKLGNAPLHLSGYAISEDADQLDLFVSLYDGSGEIAGISDADTKAAAEQCLRFVARSADGKLASSMDQSNDAYELAVTIQGCYASLEQIRIYVLTDRQAKTKNFKQRDVAGKIIKLEVMDIERLFRHWSAGKPRDELVVNFEEVAGSALPCVHVPGDMSEYDYIMTVIPGECLRFVYEKFGARMLEANVRAFLSITGKVNKGIRDTLRDAPDRFMAYNNGIVLVVDEVGFGETDAGGPGIAWLKGMQIVNGGQTTASIENVQRNDKQAEVERAFVPMKLAVVTGEASARMVEDISRYANSQNKVSDADFFANHPFHQRLEQMSRRTWAPPRRGKQYQTRWYYERARGQYLNEFARLTTAQRERLKLEIPKDQLVTKTDLARCELTWQERPFNVSAGAQIVTNEFAKRISEAWKSDADAFSEEYFRNAIARLIVFRTTEKLVSSQSWYVVGFRAIVVSYAIARLAALIGSAGSPVLDLRRIWQEQEVYPELTDMLLVIAEDVAAYLVEEGKTRNVTQWVKRQSCWEDVKKSRISMLPQFAATLVAADQMRASLRSSRALRQVDSGIDDQTAVANLGSGYWLALLAWAGANGIVGESDARIIRGAAGVSENFPTDKQSKRLLLVKKRCEDEGFVFRT